MAHYAEIYAVCILFQSLVEAKNFWYERMKDFNCNSNPHLSNILSMVASIFPFRYDKNIRAAST